MVDMRTGRYQPVVRAVLLLLTGLLLISPVSPATAEEVCAAAPLMTITALDYGSDRVEGGDAVLLSSGGSYLLMDTENNDETHKVIRYLKSHKIRKLSLYLSHWHEDHFFYLWEIMDDPYFTVEKLYLPKTTWVKQCAKSKYRNRDWYSNAVRCWKGIPAAGLYGAKSVIRKAKKEKVPVKYLKKGSSFQIGNAHAEVLWCGCSCKLSSRGFFEYMNDRSLVTKFTAGDMAYLTAGDINDEVFTLMKKRGLDLQADVYKLSHHGEGDTAATIRMIRPAYAFYCDSTEKKGNIRWTAGRRKIAKMTHLYSVRYNGNITFRLYGKTAKTPVKVTTQRNRKASVVV